MWLMERSSLIGVRGLGVVYFYLYISGPSSGEMIYSRLNGKTAETCVEHVKRFIVKNYLKLKIHGKNVKLTNFYYILVRIASGCHLNKNCSNKFSKIYYLHDKKKQVHIKYVHIHNAFGKSYFRYIHVSTLY